MLKKRIIFTLLYCDGFFVQSRNFNLQKVGDVAWLEKNYDFKKISYYIDELIILDISRTNKNFNEFIKNLKSITKFCFMPISVGGGIEKFEDVKKILSNGADKVVVNTNLELNLLKKISKTYGEQSIIASVDLKKDKTKHHVYKKNGSVKINISVKKYISEIIRYPVGEILINSIDQDGTGTGLDFELLNNIPASFNKSLIMSGGCGNYKHLFDGLRHKKIDAVNTSNLLNFVGDGLKNARQEILKNKFLLPTWEVDVIKKLEGKFK
jgi:cyclase